MASSDQGHNPSSNHEPDLVLDGTQDWKRNAPSKLSTGGFRACSFIIAEEIFDRVAYDGLSGGLVTYLTTEIQESNATASVNVNRWIGTTFLTAILGGFVADEFLGRFKTIVIFTTGYLIGLTLLTITVSLDKLKPHCVDVNDQTIKCPGQHPGLLFFAIYLVAVGAGGSKPCASAFGGDQLDDSNLTDRSRKASFFNWWIFAQSCANVVALTAFVTIQQNVGWGWGYGIPTVLLAIALVVFVGGAPFYRYSPVGGSPLTQVARVLIAAVRNSRVPFPASKLGDQSLLYEGEAVDFLKPERRKLLHTQQFRFLDKAALRVHDVSGDADRGVSRWRLCSVTEVEEVKQIVRTIPIWLSLIPFSIATAQSHSLFIRQGSTMDRRLGHSAVKIPSATVGIFLTLTMVLFVPLYDRVLVPVARKFTGQYRGVSLLQRMGTGIFLGMVGMIAAALVERKRLRTAASSHLLHKPRATLPISVFWLVPQYVLFGIAESFTSIGRLEFFYDQAPESMRSLGTAMYLASVGVGNFLSSVLINIVNDATREQARGEWIGTNLNTSHIDDFYWLLAVMLLGELVLYVWLASWYRYRNAGSKISSLPASSGDDEEPSKLV